MNKLNSNPSKTVLTICVGMLVINVLTQNVIFINISLSIGLAGVFFTQISVLIEKLWFKLAYILGLIIPNILLSIIFYIFLFPISIVSKIFKKDDLLKLKNTKSSSFILLDKSFDKNSFENPW
jgi:hypothetical protein